jgi:hypothetical protein
MEYLIECLMENKCHNGYNKKTTNKEGIINNTIVLDHFRCFKKIIKFQGRDYFNVFNIMKRGNIKIKHVLYILKQKGINKAAIFNYLALINTRFFRYIVKNTNYYVNFISRRFTGLYDKITKENHTYILYIPEPDITMYYNNIFYLLLYIRKGSWVFEI